MNLQPFNTWQSLTTLTCSWIHFCPMMNNNIIYIEEGLTFFPSQTCVHQTDEILFKYANYISQGIYMLLLLDHYVGWDWNLVGTSNGWSVLA